MQAFVRFIFFILVAGIGLNLAIVLLANTRSQSQQKTDAREARKLFLQRVADADGHFRRLDIVVESQVRNSEGATQSTLFVRQYSSTGRDQKGTLPVERVVIPGDRVSVEGVVLSFSQLFAQDAEAEDYRLPFNGQLAGTQLAYFGIICGESQLAAPSGADDRFTFLPSLLPPELTRIRPREPQPSFYEIRLWQYIWGLIGDLPRDLANGRPYSTKQRGLEITCIKPITHTVTLGYVYSVFMFPNGTMNVEEAADPAVRDDMLAEGKTLKDADTELGLGR